MNILQAIADPSLFAPFFRDRASWASWRTFLGALFGLPVEDASLYLECTGGRPLPTQQAREAFLIVGRRGGKSFICALIGVFLAAFRTYRLSAGENGIVMLLAADQRQARVLFRYAKAFIEGVPMLRPMIVRETADAIELNNGITLEVHTASFRSVRGYTIVAALCDEAAYWRSDESANPDTEILNALRPAMATVPGAMLLVLSTPYSRSGVLWDAYRRHFGKESDVLVWQIEARLVAVSLLVLPVCSMRLSWLMCSPATTLASSNVLNPSATRTALSGDFMDPMLLKCRPQVSGPGSLTHPAIG
jgi:hypothetical protein